MNTKFKIHRLTIVFLLVNFLTVFNITANAQGPLKASAAFKSYNGKPESCYRAADAELTITASGGAGDYTYSIDNGKTFVTTNVFSNLETGKNYVFVVKDKAGSKTTPQWIWADRVDNPVNLSIYYVSNSTCDNPTAGYIESGAWGGTGSITYSIDNGATFQSSGNFTNVPAGTYNIIARDANGCSSVVKTATVGGSFSAILTGDTTVTPNATFSLNVRIQDPQGTTSSRYAITGRDNFGTLYEYSDLQLGQNSRDFTSPVSIVFTILSVTKKNSSCKGYVAGTATVTVKEEYVWKGITADWHTAKNWAANKVPTATGDVRIPKQKNNPVITGRALAKNVFIEKDASLIVKGTLAVTGQIESVDAQAIDATEGTIEMNGKAAQNLDGQYFKGNSVKNLSFGNDVNLSSALDVFGQITFLPGTGHNFNTNDNLTLKSTANGSASVGPLINGNRIRGKVTIERYFPARKGWKFISVATESNQTIHDAWQEGQTAGNTTGIKGYGIQLTGPGNWSANGFDRSSPAPSIKTYDSKTNLWVGVPSTLAPFSDKSNAYMVFIRGDRSAHDGNSPETETVLRTRGELKYGPQSTISIPKEKFVAVGNPYPADLDLSRISKSNQDLFFYVWDPKLGNSYGAYQTFTNIGGGEYLVTPGMGSYANIPSNIIPAGQAFFVYNANGGTLQISEDSKAAANTASNFGRRMDDGMSTPAQDLKIKLYTVSTTGDKSLVDGIYQRFDDQYSMDIDQFDAMKSANTGENLSVKRAGKLLAVESRPFSASSDTTVLNVAGMSYTTYQFEIDFNQLNDERDAVLIDKFTNTRTVLGRGQVSQYQFTVVNNSGSYAANRFEIVMIPKKAAPVTFTFLKAELKRDEVAVSWSIENEKNVVNYQVERSTDGVQFKEIGTVGASQSAGYSFTDVNPNAGTNFYRIVSVDVDGRKGYSSITKVNNVAGSEELISVQPNPIVGNDVNLQLKLNSKGTYFVSIRNQIGQVVDNRQIDWNGTQVNFTINLSTKLLSGVYTIEVVHPSGERSVVRFIK